MSNKSDLSPKYSVFDLETETNALYKRKASPWHPENWVVALGFKHQHGEVIGKYYGTNREGYKFPAIPESVKILAGFNIKFDLLWSWKQPELQAFLNRGGKIWDCQYAEYLLAGQQEYAQMLAMDDIVELYGGTLKNDEVKALWAAGVPTHQIPEDLLMSYLSGPEGDIVNTELIFIGQYRKAREEGMLDNIMQRMEGLLATTMMEFNGIYVDKARGIEEAASLEAEISALDKSLWQYIPEDKPDEIEFKWSNRYHLSPLLFGGSIKYERWTPHLDERGGQIYVGKKVAAYVLDDGTTYPCDEYELALAGGIPDTRTRYKSGKNAGSYITKQITVPDLDKPKGAKNEYFWELPGYTKPLDSWASSTPGLYSVSAEVIELLGNRDIPFLKALAKRAKLNKDLTTYYISTDPETGEQKGMLTLVGADGIVHHGLNHTLTVTSRLSSSNPNMQNIPRGDTSRIKLLFSSRFGEDGVVLEADYSQLEVYGKGALSGDKNLKADLRAKIDFHCKRVAAKYGITYEEALRYCKDETYEDYKTWKARRTGAKEFSFQRAYGAGAAAIAASTGMTVEDVEQLIEAEERMYPDVSKFDADVQAAVERSAWVTGRFERTKSGKPFQIKKGEWRSPMGTRYVFTSKEALEYQQKRGVLTTFMPTEMKNYPTQGECGFMVQGMIGRLSRLFLENNNYGGKAFLVNTVHDSVWADAHKSVAKQVAADMQRIMESIPEWANTWFGWELDIPFPVDVEAGANLYEKQSVEHYFS